MKEINAKGLACPAPVIQTKSIVETEKPDVVRVFVDNEAASQNVSRYLASQQYEVTVQPQGGDFQVQGTRNPDAAAAAESPAEHSSGRQKILVLVSSDKMGTGDDELGQKLMISFLKTVNEMGPDLWRLVFVNNGVKFTIEDSPVLNELKQLAETGCTILVCGTCLTHFHLLEKKQVGETTNMLDIVTAMQLADKAISL